MKNYKATAFLSYGHEDNMELINTIVDEFERAGFFVWTDKMIEYSDRWIKEIDDNISKSDFFVFIYGVSSTREDSYCWGEIAKAKANRYSKVVTIRISNVELSSIIAADQLLDLNGMIGDDGTFSLPDVKENIKRLCGQLLKKKEEQSANSCLKNIIDTIDFHSDLQKNTYPSVTRWLRRDYIKWKAQDALPLYVIIGNPGSGKTVRCTELYNNENGEKIIFYINHDDRRTQNIKLFLQTIAYEYAQFSAPYSAYLMNSPSIRSLDYKASGEVYNALFGVAFQNAVHTKPVTIFVDALDELPEEDFFEFIKYIKSFLNIGGIRFVFASRPKKTIMAEVLPYAFITDNLEKHNSDIIHELAQKQSGGSFSSESVDEIVEQCQGDIIYATLCLNEMNKYRTLKNKMPEGMNGICMNYFNRLFEHTDFHAYRAFLSVMCASREPLSVYDMREILNEDAYELNEKIKLLEDFVDLTDNMLSFKHKSIYDWLSTISLGNRYYISLQSGNELIANWAIASFNTADNIEENSYLARNGLAHILQAEQIDFIIELFHDDSQTISLLLSKFVFILFEDKNPCALKIIKRVLRTDYCMERSFLNLLKFLLEKNVAFDSNGIMHEISLSENKDVLSRFVRFFSAGLGGKNSNEVIEIGKTIMNCFDETTNADILKNIGDAYRRQGIHETAIAYYLQVVQLLETFKASSVYMESSCAIADLHNVNGDVEKALKTLEGITAYLESMPTSLANYKYLKLKGEVYKRLGDREKALQSFKQSLEVAVCLMAPIQIFDANNNIAECCDDFEEANSILQKNIELYHSYQYNRLYFGKTNLILADKYLNRDIAQSMEYAQTGLTVFSDIEYGSGVASANAMIGRILKEKGDYTEAAKHFVFAAEYYRRERIYPDLLMSVLAQLYDMVCDSPEFEKYYYLFSFDAIHCEGNYPIFEKIEQIDKKIHYSETKEQILSFFAQGPTDSMHGYYNDNYLLPLNNQKYLLRVSRPEEFAADYHLMDETLLLGRLNLMGISAPRVYYSFVIQGKNVSLLEYIEGNQLQPPLSKEQMTRIALSMSCCHELNVNDFAFLNKQIKLDNAEKWASFNIKFIEDIYKLESSRFNRVFGLLKLPADFAVQFMDTEHITDEPVSFCHGDVHYGNILVDTSEQMHIIDWELASIAPLTMDLASHIHRMNYSAEEQAAFLECYTSCNPLAVLYADNIKVFLDYEIIKSAIVDLIRYLDETAENGDLAFAQAKANKYAPKLDKAYKLWGIQHTAEGTQKLVDSVFLSVAKRRQLL